jgi:hypothetical protein
MISCKMKFEIYFSRLGRRWIGLYVMYFTVKFNFLILFIAQFCKRFGKCKYIFGLKLWKIVIHVASVVCDLGIMLDRIAVSWKTDAL